MSRREENISLDEGRKGQGDRGSPAAFVDGQPVQLCRRDLASLMLCFHCLEILNNFSANDSKFLFCTEPLELCSWSWREKLKTGCDPFSVWPSVCWLESSADWGYIWSELLTQMPLTEKKFWSIWGGKCTGWGWNILPNREQGSCQTLLDLFQKV